MTHTRKQPFNVYEALTNQIIAAVEESDGKVTLPWHKSGYSFPTNVASRKEYNGVNVIGLWAVSEVESYHESLWGTYKQWQSVGAQVRKGEKSSVVVFYKTFEKGEDEGKDNGTEKEGGRCVARASRVFNVAQVEGYELPTTEQGESLVDPIPDVEAFVQSTGAEIHEEGQRAFYSKSQDSITMPERSRFFGPDGHTITEGWYSVLCHELTHWSGAKGRLDREFGKRFGDDTYAMEELVAELGAAFLCNRLGISSEPRPDHANYIAHWLRVMKGDNKAIFTAASAAQKAADYLMGTT